MSHTSAPCDHLPAADMPPITEHQLRTAFEKLHWAKFTYDQVMADPIRRKVVLACAHQLRRDEWELNHTRTVEPVTRCRPGADGHPMKWRTQMAQGPWVRQATPDLFTNQPPTQPCQL